MGSLLNTKSLLLIHDQKPQVGKIGVQKGVGADEHIYVACCGVFFDPVIIAVTQQYLDPDARLSKRVFPASVMLFGKQARRYKKGYLLAVLHGFNTGKHGYHRLACTYVAVDKSVHRLSFLHVAANVSDGRPLSVRKFKG